MRSKDGKPNTKHRQTKKTPKRQKSKSKQPSTTTEDSQKALHLAERSPTMRGVISYGSYELVISCIT